jgi:hypothetical protein
MATKQLRNKALFATANDYGRNKSELALLLIRSIDELAYAYLIIACYELCNSVPQCYSSEFPGPGYLLYDPVKVCLFCHSISLF